MFEIHGWDSEATYAKVFNNLIPWWRAQAYLHFDNTFGSVTNNRIIISPAWWPDWLSFRLSVERKKLASSDLFPASLYFFSRSL